MQEGLTGEKAEEGEAVTSGAIADHERDADLRKGQEGCLVEEEGSPVWGWEEEGDPRVTR